MLEECHRYGEIGENSNVDASMGYTRLSCQNVISALLPKYTTSRRRASLVKSTHTLGFGKFAMGLGRRLSIVPWACE